MQSPPPVFLNTESYNIVHFSYFIIVKPFRKVIYSAILCISRNVHAVNFSKSYLCDVREQC